MLTSWRDRSVNGLYHISTLPNICDAIYKGQTNLCLTFDANTCQTLLFGFPDADREGVKILADPHLNTSLNLSKARHLDELEVDLLCHALFPTLKILLLPMPQTSNVTTNIFDSPQENATTVHNDNIDGIALSQNYVHHE